jgi:hypothetical protein
VLIAIVVAILAAVAGSANTGSAMDSHPDVPLASHRRLAGMDAHADPEIGRLGPSVLAEAALAGNRRRDGVFGAPERDKERVTLRVDLAAVMFAERLAQDSPMLVECLAVPLATQQLEQPR